MKITIALEFTDQEVLKHAEKLIDKKLNDPEFREFIDPLFSALEKFAYGDRPKRRVQANTFIIRRKEDDKFLTVSYDPVSKLPRWVGRDDFEFIGEVLEFKDQDSAWEHAKDLFKDALLPGKLISDIVEIMEIVYRDDDDYYVTSATTKME